MGLKITDIRHNYGQVEVLKGIELSLDKGKIMALLGESGCGKTTLLRLIAGFENIQRGEIYWEDRLWGSESVNFPTEKRGIAYVFQDLVLFPHLSVAQNIGFGIKDRDARNEKIALMADLFRLNPQLKLKPAQLSGGQKQRVALARALATDPELLLLDESFNSLDRVLRTELRLEIQEIIRRLNITTMMVTHDVEDAFQLADMVAVMSAGQIEQIDNPARVYSKPTSAIVAQLTGTVNQLIEPIAQIPAGLIRPENLEISGTGEWLLTARMFMNGYYEYNARLGEKQLLVRDIKEFEVGQLVNINFKES